MAMRQALLRPMMRSDTRPATRWARQVDPEPGGEEWMRRKAAGERLRAAVEAKRQP